MTPLSRLFPSSSETSNPEVQPHEKMSTGEIIFRIVITYFYFLFGWIITIPVSLFSLFYALLTPLTVHGNIMKQSGPEFSFFTSMKNNLKFYSRGYLTFFSFLLVYETYLNMNITTVIGCIVAIIILIFGTSIFNSYVPDDSEISFSDTQCESNPIKMFNKNKNKDNKDNNTMLPNLVPIAAVPLTEPLATPLTEPLATPLQPGLGPLQPEVMQTEQLQPKNPINELNQLGGKHIKKSSSKLSKTKKYKIN